MAEDNNTEINEEVIRRLRVRGEDVMLKSSFVADEECRAAEAASGRTLVEDGLQFLIPMDVVAGLVERVYGYLIGKLVIKGLEDYEKERVSTVPGEDGVYLNYKLTRKAVGQGVCANCGKPPEDSLIWTPHGELCEECHDAWEMMSRV